MGPTRGVRREIFSNTAGVLNWPSFSISIDFPTVYIDFLNILSKVGSREATWNNVIGNKSQDTLKLRTFLLFRNNFCSLYIHTYANTILSMSEFEDKIFFVWFYFQGKVFRLGNPFIKSLCPTRITNFLSCQKENNSPATFCPLFKLSK